MLGLWCKIIFERKKEGLCTLFSDQIKLQFAEGHTVVLEDSDIWNPECVSFSCVSVHVFFFPSLHQIRLLCSNDLLVFLNIKGNIIGYFTQDCQEVFKS